MAAGWTYQERRKPNCGRCAAGAGHGPYWYGFRRRRGRVESRYFGKRRPRGARPPSDHQQPGESHPPGGDNQPRPARAAMDYAEALRAFGLGRDPTAGQIQARFRELAKRHHSDKRGGDKERMQRVNAAYEVLRRRHGGAGS